MKRFFPIKPGPPRISGPAVTMVAAWYPDYFKAVRPAMPAGHSRNMVPAYATIPFKAKAPAHHRPGEVNPDDIIPVDERNFENL
jgi:hypothetical protein